MNPETGTFTSMDTYAGSVFDPVSLHKYLYANANPVSYTDPSGYFSLSEVVTTMAISSVLGGMIGSGIEILRQLAINPDFTSLNWNQIGKAAIIGMGVGLLVGALAGLAEYFVLASAAFSIIQVGFGVMALKTAASDWSTYHNWKLVSLDLLLAFVSFASVEKSAARTKNLYDAKHTAKAAETAKSVTDSSPENTNTSSNNSNNETFVFNESGREIDISRWNSNENGAWSYNQGLGIKAPKHVTPGTRYLEGQYINIKGQVQPWKAYYNQWGQLIARTDYNAANQSTNPPIPKIHYHLYGWRPGMEGAEIGSHIPGEYNP